MNNQQELTQKAIKSIYFDEYAAADKTLQALVNEKLKARMRDLVKKGCKPCKKGEKEDK